VIRALVAAAALLAAPASVSAAGREIAFTFDDLPAHAALPPGVTRIEVARGIIAALKAAHVPRVYGFINGVQLAREPGSDAVLTAWTAAGFPLGNHGWSHQGLSTLDQAGFEREVAQNEPMLTALMGKRDWRWFRFPFLDEAAAVPARRIASRQYLAARGYRIAAVTASFGDWAFNDSYARCMAKGDRAAVAEMERAFLDAADASIRLSQATQQAQFGRTPPDILLMHIGAFDARMLPRLLALYRKHGFRFVPLDRAARDPANVGLVDPRLPPLPGRTMGDAASAAMLTRVQGLCR
jgi:peptidoglycan/xylan/chitin deacetylase (PgdA/CDA1 family)